jgi:hypothetical protein
MDKLQWRYLTGDINEWLKSYVLLRQENGPRLRRERREEKERGRCYLGFTGLHALSQKTITAMPQLSAIFGNADL